MTIANNRKIETITGVLSFCVGVVYLLMVLSAAPYVHSVREGTFVGLVGVWSVALLVTS